MQKLIQLEVSTIQAMLRYNKQQIKELDTERKYLQHIAGLFYNSCDPFNPKGVLSSTAFHSLNKAKDEIQAIKKKLKVIVEFQTALKRSIQG